MENELDLSRSVGGKFVLVTGAASGIGRATAQVFAQEGATVAVTDLDQAKVDTVAKGITEAGGKAHAWALDVSDGGEITKITAEIIQHFGQLDILINNAGVSAGAPLGAPNFEEAWDKTLQINLTAHVRMIRACLPELSREGKGRIVNVASTEGLGATAGISPYTASKHGVIGLTRSLAVELGAQGVTVNCVCPGPIRTGMTEPIPEDSKQKFARRRVPLRRYGHPEELAHGILHLALPASSYINGHALVIDGGMTIQNT